MNQRSDEAPRASNRTRSAGARPSGVRARGRANHGLLWWLRRATFLVLIAGMLSVGGVFAALDRVKIPQSKVPAQTSFVCLSGVDDGKCGLDNAVVEMSQQNRTLLTYDQLPKVMIQAVVAGEDRDFFSHAGIDPMGIGRAIYRDLTNTSQSRQGGSTITQQYVKLTYLSSERTLTRKIKEMALAVKLERKYSKTEILTRYLNEIYFGRNAYGVEAAARVYFGKAARDLTIDEAALLVGLIRSPGDDPAQQRDVALRRRNSVISLMAEAGFITPDQAKAARSRTLEASLLDKAPAVNNLRVDPDFAKVGGEYIAEWVRQQLNTMLGSGAALTRGLRVYLTISPANQRYAWNAINQTLGRPEDPLASLVSVDESGRILAMIGNRDYATSNVNIALGREGGGSGRPAGSTFKPFALAAFIESGNSIQSVFSAPAKMDFPRLDNGKTWSVSNFEDEDFGNTTVAKATAHSVNTVYAQMMVNVGAKKVAEMANRLGVTAPVSAVPSVVLGTTDVSVLDMARAYSTLARHGVKIDPYVIRRVEGPDGTVLYDAKPTSEQVISADVADTVTYALRGVLTADGTGSQAAFRRAAAGKTGTTNDNKDAWFVGYTCHVTAAVWMGFDPPQPMLNIHGADAVTGGKFPARIWKSYMSQATSNTGKCTYRELDAGTNKVNPELLEAPPTTTTTIPGTPALPGDPTATTTVPGATTTTTPSAG